MNNWHMYQGRVKNCNERKREKDSRINDWQKKGVHFFSKGYCEKCTGEKQQRKKEIEKIVKNWSANNFYQRKLFWDTPVYHVID